MGYLLCNKCGGYYELQPGEYPDDFTKCECGGKLEYVESLGRDPEPEVKEEKIKREEPVVEKKKDKSVKYCVTCGQPLPGTKKFNTSKIDTTKQKKAATNFIGSSKDRFMGLSPRMKVFSIGGVLILLLLIGVFALPGGSTAAYFNSTNVSFNYPSNLEVIDSYMVNGWRLSNKSTAHYAIWVGTDPTEFAIEPTSMDEATIPGEVVDEMNQTAYENNRSANNTEPNWFLKQTIKDFEAKYKVSKRSVNGYTYYEAQDESKFFYKTIIVKDGSKYFYTIYIGKLGGTKPEYYNEAVEGCKMVVDSFKIIQ